MTSDGGVSTCDRRHGSRAACVVGGIRDQDFDDDSKFNFIEKSKYFFNNFGCC